MSDWKKVGSVILLMEMHRFDPVLFIGQRPQRVYGNDIVVCDFGTYLGEAWTWRLSTKDAEVRPGDREDVFFDLGQAVKLRYTVGDDDLTEYVRFEPNKGPSMITFCYDPANARKIWAGWTVSAALAFLDDKCHHVVRELETYAFSTLRCSDELRKKIEVERIAIVPNTSPTIGIAGFSSRPGTGTPLVSAEDSLLLASCLHFMDMEIKLQRAAHEMGQKVASASRDFHPELGF